MRTAVEWRKSCGHGARASKLAEAFIEQLKSSRFFLGRIRTDSPHRPHPHRNESDATVGDARKTISSRPDSGQNLVSTRQQPSFWGQKVQSGGGEVHAGYRKCGGR